MRPAIALAALLLALPTALAAPPFLEAWDGHASVRAFLANQTTLCAASGEAQLIIEREMEAATFVLVPAAGCVPALVLRGTLSGHGWVFHDSFGVQSGSFAPTDHPGVWALHALVDTCPAFVLCELPHGVRVSGTFQDPTILF